MHGGAGSWAHEQEVKAIAGVRAAAQVGAKILASGGSALEAAVEAVVVLEDDPIFNAGTGSVLNSVGDVEMDAAVMNGCTLQAGGVACLRRVKNPVRVAHRVMEATPHVLLCGEGALRFARAQDFGDYDPITPERREDFQRKRDQPGNTVGAVTLDRRGNLAAATSTGGVSLKLPGRVGDSPVPGAGNYASPGAASSFTGTGELALRFLATKTACDLIESGRSAQEAAALTLSRMAKSVGRNAGIIAVDAKGRIGAAHLTAAMPHAFIARAGGKLVARLRAGTTRP